MIVDVTKHIAQLIKSGAISSNDVSPEYVDKLLQGLWLSAIHYTYYLLCHSIKY